MWKNTAPGHMQQGRFFESVLSKVVSPKKASMESTSSSGKPSLQALSSPPPSQAPSHFRLHCKHSLWGWDISL